MSSTGPWLLVESDEGWSVLNADGTGRTLFAGIGFAGAGGALAFVEQPIHPFTPEGTELVIYQLPDTTGQRRIPLFSAAARQAINPSDERLDDCDPFFDIVYAPFAHWSPDGRRLAIAAAIEGSTIDIYVYDAEEDIVRQITREAGRAKLLPAFDPWSPDGRWISYLELGLSPCSVVANWVAAADGSGRRLLPGSGDLEAVAWMGASRLLLSGEPSQSESVVLESYAFITAERTRLLEGDWDFLAADPGSGTVLFSPCIGAPVGMGQCVGEASDLDNGLYLIPGGSSRIIRIETGVRRSHWPIRWHPQLNRFTASIETSTTVATFLIDREGEVTGRMPEWCAPQPSPNGLWLAFSCGDHADVTLYDGKGEFIANLGPPGIRNYMWHPDSTSIFYLSKRPQRTGYNQVLDPYTIGAVTVPGGVLEPLAHLPDLRPGGSTSLTVIE